MVNAPGRESGDPWFETCSGVWYPRRRRGVGINTPVDLVNRLGIHPRVFSEGGESKTESGHTHARTSLSFAARFKDICLCLRNLFMSQCAARARACVPRVPPRARARPRHHAQCAVRAYVRACVISGGGPAPVRNQPQSRPPSEISRDLGPRPKTRREYHTRSRTPAFGGGFRVFRPLLSDSDSEPATFRASFRVSKFASEFPGQRLPCQRLWSI